MPHWPDVGHMATPGGRQGVLGMQIPEWTSPASSQRQTRVGGEGGVRGRVGSHLSSCLPEEMACSPQPYRGEPGATGREISLNKPSE